MLAQPDQDQHDQDEDGGEDEEEDAEAEAVSLFLFVLTGEPGFSALWELGLAWFGVLYEDVDEDVWGQGAVFERWE